jgi:hypothetical protein
MMPPIGICGYGGSGKDTIAYYVVNTYEYKKRAFADKLRELIYEIDPYLVQCNTSYRKIVDAEGYEVAKRRYSEIRNWLVAIGEGNRTVFGKSFWIKQCDLTSEDLVVSDVRNKYEAKAIRKLGGQIWYVSKPGVSGHPIERETITKIRFDRVIRNDGSLEALYSKIDDIFAEL